MPEPAAAGLSAKKVRLRLAFLSALGHGFLESGQTTRQTEEALGRYGRELGLDGLVLNSFGRMLLLEAVTRDGGTVSLSGAARSRDAIDCTKARAFERLAERTVEDART